MVFCRSLFWCVFFSFVLYVFRWGPVCRHCNIINKVVLFTILFEFIEIFCCFICECTMNSGISFFEPFPYSLYNSLNCKLISILIGNPNKGRNEARVVIFDFDICLKEIESVFGNFDDFNKPTTCFSNLIKTRVIPCMKGNTFEFDLTTIAWQKLWGSMFGNVRSLKFDIILSNCSPPSIFTKEVH